MTRIDEARRRYLELDEREQAWTEKQYKRAGKELRAELARIGERIETEGRTLNLATQQARLEVLIRQTSEELVALASVVDERVTANAATVAADSARAASDFLTGGILNTEAAVQAATATADNTRLASLLEARVPGFASEVRSQVVQGIVQGKGPREMARIAERAVGKQGWNARTIMRTEMSRAHNDAARLTYQAAGVAEYQWLSAADSRTCPACFALHGTRYSTGEERPAHPNCRCTIVPVVAGLRPIVSGETAFARLPVSEQLYVLGPGRFQKWREGVPISEMAQIRTHPVWGPTVSQRPIEALR